MDQIMKRYEIEQVQKWREEAETIPFITFPAGWKVQIIPPFGDAVVRFKVELPTGEHRSVYLDSRNSLGHYRGDDMEPMPYWEVYPYRGDVGRCDKSNVDELLQMIGDVLSEEEGLEAELISVKKFNDQLCAVNDQLLEQRTMLVEALQQVIDLPEDSLIHFKVARKALAKLANELLEGK